MKTSQKRAIWYAQRERKIERVKKAGLWDEYRKSRFVYLNCFLRSIGRFDLM